MIFIPYLFIFYFMFFAFLCRFPDIKERKVIEASVFFQFTIIILFFYGLRGFLWTDWVNYYKYYDKIPNTLTGLFNNYETGKNSYEIGFSLFTYLCKKISNNYFLFQFINFLVDFILLHLFFNYYKSEYEILNFIFFFIFAGTQIEIDLLRNSKSILIFILSLRYLSEEKSFFKYCLVNFVGFLFHSSAIVVIPLYFFIRKRHSYIFYIVILLVCSLIMFLKIPVAKQFFIFITQFIPNGRMIEKVVMYINNSQFSQQSVFSFIFLERIISFSIFIYFYKKGLLSSKYVFMNIFALYFIVCFGFWDFYIVVQRLGFIFICGYWVLYPEIYYRLKRQSKMIFILLVFLFGSYKTISDNSFSIHKYNTCFTEKPYSIKAKELLKTQ